MDRQTLRDLIHRYNAEGIEGLGNRRGGGTKPQLTSDQMAQLAIWVKDGPDPERDGVVRWRRVDLARQIEMVFGIKLHERTVGRYLAKRGFGDCRCALNTLRPTGRPKLIKKNFAARVAEILPDRAKVKPLEIWFQDEARVGQQGTLTRIWAKRGMRPCAPRDTRYKWSYIFGAACPGRGTAAGLILPCVNTEAMGLHLTEISRTEAADAHALLIVDGAG